VRDKCILKQFKDENIDISSIEHMSDNELTKDFGLKQKNVDRLRARINHIVERKYDSESCYAGLKADFGEMIQAIIDIRHVFGSFRQCVPHKTDCKSSPTPSQSVEDMSDNEFLEDCGLLNRPRIEPICTEPICKDLSYQRLWWSQQNGYQEWQASSNAIKHLNATFELFYFLKKTWTPSALHTPSEKEFITKMRLEFITEMRYNCENFRNYARDMLLYIHPDKFDDSPSVSTRIEQGPFLQVL
jgi:hypothetical protein